MIGSERTGTKISKGEGERKATKKGGSEWGSQGGTAGVKRAANLVSPFDIYRQKGVWV